MSDDYYFDPMRGWVTPADDYESDTSASLKDIIAVLKSGIEPSNQMYDAVEQLLYKYQIFAQQGIREKIADHHGVSWYLVEKCDGKRALISFQDGPRGEWHQECYADEVPLWLLTGLFRRIQHRKPLGDQEADETIARVDALDASYIRRPDEYAPHLGKEGG